MSSDQVKYALRRCAPEYGLEFSTDVEPRATDDGRLEYRCWLPGLGLDKKHAVVLLPASIRSASAPAMIDVVRMELGRVAAAAGLPLPHRYDQFKCALFHARPGGMCGCDVGAAPVRSFTLIGGWRVYFNRHGATGRPWCVAPNTGGWEVAVSSVAITTAANTTYQPKATPDDEDGRPSAWIAVDGRLTVYLAGHAAIDNASALEVQQR